MSSKAGAPSDLKILALRPSALGEAEKVLEESCEFDLAHQVAEEKLFGPGALDLEAEPLAAYLGPELVGVASISARWIRLIAVHPQHRKRGIGSALLDACTERISLHSAQARTMDQPGNYLSPGIDNRNIETIAWLAKRGFCNTSEACNLLIELHDNERISEANFREREGLLKAAGYSISRMQESQLEGVCQMVETIFSSGWAFEVRLAAQAPGGVHLAVHEKSQEVVAFSVHDGNNRGLGCFGPTGTLHAHRGKGLGAALLLASLLEIAAEGHPKAEVAWIGPREFYDKIAGIESERHFSVMTKTLREEDTND